MRRFLALLLSLMTVLAALCSCGSNDPKTETPDKDQIIEPSDKEPNAEENDVEDTGKKIDGEIIAASVFSEGLAFVEISGEEGKTYCIDKKGNVVFELNIDLSTNSDIFSVFNNGLAYVNEGFCDKTGKVTTPADVGATGFYYTATLSAGYIIAEVVTSDYSSTSKKLGVLNTEFEWTVEPSEEIYKSLADENGYLGLYNVLNTSDFTVGDIYYNVEVKKGLNLKTGEVINERSEIGAPESSLWIAGSNSFQYTGYYISDDRSDLSAATLAVDLTKNGVVCSASSFVDGRAAIVYHNADANKYYVTMIDEAGEHLFEPVETKYSFVRTDGEYILVTDESLGSGDRGEVFNSKGEKTGEIDVSLDSNYSYNFDLCDGVILVSAGRNSTAKVYYLDAECKDLF
ncbi:MAG: hypothetical protein E7647_03765 [Ruminococcaceae bacterium]|nr:hypothetical protein [Oscillospiraceae bacterium]